MRMPRVRFRLRTLMILVAVVAVGIVGAFEGVKLKRQRDFYLFLATLHKQMSAFEVQSRSTYEALQKISELGGAGDDSSERGRDLQKLRGSMREFWTRQGVNHRARARLASEKADYHAKLSRKYAHAARFPWLSVPSNPPMPTLPETASPPTQPLEPETPPARPRRMSVPSTIT